MANVQKDRIFIYWYSVMNLRIKKYFAKLILHTQEKNTTFSHQIL